MKCVMKMYCEITFIFIWWQAMMRFFFFFFQAEDGIRDSSTSRGLGDVYKRQYLYRVITITP